MQPHPQGLSIHVPFSRDYFVLLTYFSKCPKSIQIWPRRAGYEESSLGF